ncbi:MAG: hypothetical protein EAY75_11190 [Bacteroidetes bacterium]|nr:MAG: hypothetical protein EAY75_11190 [Bacteroidota bacterium]
MRLYPAAVLFFLLWACKSGTAPTKPAPTITDSTGTAAAMEPLYPFTQYLKEQIAYVDSTPFAIEKTVYQNGKRTDSGLITHAEFLALAAPFCQYDVNSSPLRTMYNEESFSDLSLNNITFSITSSNPSLPLRQATVLLLPETKRVKNVILQVNTTKGDTTIVDNMLWVHNQSFQISSTLYYGNQRQTRNTKVVWDKP